jgi:hypothetical protein
MISREWILAVIAAGALIAIPACGANGTSGFSSGPTTPSGSLAHGTMSATIGGLPWVATVSLTATFDGKVLSLVGADSTTVLSVAISSPGSPVPNLAIGTYGIGLNSPTTATLSLTAATAETFVANASGGFGSVVLDTLTSTGASGSFSFTLLPTVGAGASEGVVNGLFNVTF